MEDMLMEVGESSTRKEHISIDIVNHDEDDLLSSIKQKMESISLTNCLSRVPEQLFKGNEEKYFPSSVSIGPFHHGQPSLKLFEDQKWRYLNALLTRKPGAEATLDACVNALRQQEHSARNFYAEKIGLNSDQFVTMLLLDGCFIIELFLVYMIKSLRRRDDPSFATNEGLFRLRCDLILFENQIPFFILDNLFHLLPFPKTSHHLSLIELALYFFKKLIPNNPQLGHFPQETIGPQAHHLLDLIRQHYLPTTPQILLPLSPGHTHIYPATSLQNNGISIERPLSQSPANITFYNGKLNIPCLEIHSYTETLFRNLIAMEQCQPGCSKHVTSYIVLIEQLVPLKRDVRLLQEREILVDGHEREGEIVYLFKRLHVDISVKEFYYRGICEEVSRHQRRKRDVWWVKMRNLYYRSKLGIAGFSLVVVVLVFLFSAAFFASASFLLHHFQ